MSTFSGFVNIDLGLFSSGTVTLSAPAAPSNKLSKSIST